MAPKWLKQVFPQGQNCSALGNDQHTEQGCDLPCQHTAAHHQQMLTGYLLTVGAREGFGDSFKAPSTCPSIYPSTYLCIRALYKCFSFLHGADIEEQGLCGRTIWLQQLERRRASQPLCASFHFIYE